MTRSEFSERIVACNTSICCKGTLTEIIIEEHRVKGHNTLLVSSWMAK